MFLMIKPDAFRRKLVGRILEQLEVCFDVVDMEMFHFIPEGVNEFYVDHVGREYYSRLQATMLTGPCLAIKVSSPWDPRHRRLAERLRHNFADLETTNKAENLIHASDSVDADIRETKLIFGG